MEFVKRFGGELERAYVVDDSPCQCGSNSVEYAVTEMIREGWHDGHIRRLPRRLQEVRLDSAKCGDCGAAFSFRLLQSEKAI